MNRYTKRKSFLTESEEQILNRRELIKELKNLKITTKQVMLGETPSTQYTWHTQNGDRGT